MGGRGLGTNAQYPLGVRRTHPAVALEKSLGFIKAKSVNKEIFYCHFITKVQIKQQFICTLLAETPTKDKGACPVRSSNHAAI
jgi:hypothetical protein